MPNKISSRSSELDMEACVNNAGSRYDLVIAASQRLREMKQRAKANNTHATTIDALKEVESGTFSMRDYLNKVK